PVRPRAWPGAEDAFGHVQFESGQQAAGAARAFDTLMDQAEQTLHLLNPRPRGQDSSNQLGDGRRDVNKVQRYQSGIDGYERQRRVQPQQVSQLRRSAGGLLAQFQHDLVAGLELRLDPVDFDLYSRFRGGQ